MKPKQTTEQFIEKAVAKHGGLFDYSDTVFNGVKNNVDIICKVHGKFTQNANSHLCGRGCPVCAKSNGAKKRIKNSSDVFIEKAKNVHGGKYDYSQFEYIKRSVKSKIICKDHGVFLQCPGTHLAGHGCPVCEKERKLNWVYSRQKKKGEEFVSRAKAIHGDKYDYSLTVYERATKPVKIICSKHGVFEQQASSHLLGCGCRYCQVEISVASLARNGKELIKKSAESFEDRARGIHGEKYDYSLVKYKGGRKKVDIICREHGVFKQCPRDHLGGASCPSCSRIGFNPKKPAILYYIEIQPEDGSLPVYKIGITNRSIEERYYLKSDYDKIKVLKTWEYPIGYDAMEKERQIVAMFKDYKYHGEKLLYNTGNYEIFAEDVLGLAI